ncbi:amidohydrolase family protein [Pseudodesulfovibrio sp. zrk46]|uniref:amidohydrolase family protein n=1 Tax=Pseudodesulfovibrio sp. zrk46 TaxID=2725288 RepID=UPI00144A1E18|nr:amidohydrolase family protein [Pseudodesulfovibrio sp. zrk46]QJB57622.1 amidohydrolase family protein [Pseudodesulfovibrio sp. zrk46]
MFIDVHTHVFHPKIADKVLAQLEGHYSITPVGTGLVDDLLDRLKAANVDKAVVLSAATDPSQVIPANNWAIQMKKEHDALIPFGTIHPDFDRVEFELDRLERNNIKGLKFHPDFQGYRMDDPKLFDVMEMIEDRFICLFHVGDILPPAENPSCPQKLAALRKMFPKPAIIAAHMGGYRHWDHVIEHLANTDVFVDTSSAMDFVSDEKLNTLFQAFGTERILFGSDYPLFDAGTEIDQLKARLSLSSVEFENVMSNATHLLI